MTGRTEGRRDAGEVTDRHRVVGRVAALAIPFQHPLGVGGMAAGTLGLIPMGQMALVAGEVVVGVGNPLLDRDHPLVTAEASPLDRPRLGEIEFQGPMGMVTGGAILQCIVGFSGGGMTAGAVDLGLLAFGRMQQMAFMTGDVGLMRPAMTGELIDHAPVTGHAGSPRIFQLGKGFGRRRMGCVTVGTIGQSKMGTLRRAVTISTGRDLAMLGVTAGAAHLLMGAPLFTDRRGRVCVAGGAEDRSNVRRVAQSGWGMGSMTEQTILVDHRLAVRLMTVEAGHRRAVLRMALATAAELRFMRGTGRREGVDRLGMADRAGRGRHIGLDFRGNRRMGRVTILTLLETHGRAVRLVAIEAGFGLTVRRMAGVALQLGVGAGGFLHLLPRFGMTGNAGRPDILHFRQRFGQRRMGRVTGGATLDRIMGLRLGVVAVGAGRQTPRLRRVLRVAFAAVAHLPMSAPGLLDFLHDDVVTTGTERRRKRRIQAHRFRRVGRMTA